MDYGTATNDDLNNEAEFLLALGPGTRRCTARERFAYVLHEVADALREAGHPAAGERTKSLLVATLDRIPGPDRASAISTIYHACHSDAGITYVTRLAGNGHQHDPFHEAVTVHKPYMPAFRALPGATVVPLASVPRRIRVVFESAALPEWPDGYRTTLNNRSGAFDDACKTYEGMREAGDRTNLY
jgi:hypothetical protein